MISSVVIGSSHSSLNQPPLPQLHKPPKSVKIQSPPKKSSWPPQLKPNALMSQSKPPPKKLPQNQLPLNAKKSSNPPKPPQPPKLPMNALKTLKPTKSPQN